MSDAKEVNFTDTTLLGNDLSEKFETFGFEFQPCEEYSDDCASDEDFRNYFLTGTVSMWLATFQ